MKRKNSYFGAVCLILLALLIPNVMAKCYDLVPNIDCDLFNRTDATSLGTTEGAGASYAAYVTSSRIVNNTNELFNASNIEGAKITTWSAVNMTIFAKINSTVGKVFVFSLMDEGEEEVYFILNTTGEVNYDVDNDITTSAHMNTGQSVVSGRYYWYAIFCDTVRERCNYYLYNESGYNMWNVTEREHSTFTTTTLNGFRFIYHTGLLGNPGAAANMDEFFACSGLNLSCHGNFTGAATGGGASDTKAPYYSNFAVNYSGIRTNGTTIKWNATIQDETGLSTALFFNNKTASNMSIVLSSNPYNAWVNYTISANVNESICGKFYFNDSSNNWNETTFLCLNVTGTSYPRFTFNTTNQTSVYPRLGDNIQLGITVNDDNGIDYVQLIIGSTSNYFIDYDTFNATDNDTIAGRMSGGGKGTYECYHGCPWIRSGRMAFLNTSTTDAPDITILGMHYNMDSTYDNATFFWKVQNELGSEFSIETGSLIEDGACLYRLNNSNEIEVPQTHNDAENLGTTYHSGVFLDETKQYWFGIYQKTYANDTNYCEYHVLELNGTEIMKYNRTTLGDYASVNIQRWRALSSELFPGWTFPNATVDDWYMCDNYNISCYNSGTETTIDIINFTTEGLGNVTVLFNETVTKFGENSYYFISGNLLNLTNTSQTFYFTTKEEPAPDINYSIFVNSTSLYSPTNTTLSDLSGICNGTIDDGNNPTLYYYRWFRERKLNSTGYEIENPLVTNLTDSETLVGNWTFSCLASNTTINSTWLNASELYIRGYTAPTITINPTSFIYGKNNSIISNNTLRTALISITLMDDYKLKGYGVTVWNSLNEKLYSWWDESFEGETSVTKEDQHNLSSSEGWYLMLLNASDNDGNVNSISYTYYSVNAPSVSYVNPTSASNYLENSAINISISVSGNYHNYTTVNLYNMTTLINSTNISFSGNGTYIYNVTFFVNNATNHKFYINATVTDGTGYISVPKIGAASTLTFREQNNPVITLNGTITDDIDAPLNISVSMKCTHKWDSYLNYTLSLNDIIQYNGYNNSNGTILTNSTQTNYSLNWMEAYCWSEYGSIYKNQNLGIIKVLFKKESTDTYVDDANMTMEVIGDTYGIYKTKGNITSGNFSLFFQESDGYTFRYYGDKLYEERFRFLTYDQNQSYNLTLYVFDNASSTQVTVVVLNQNGDFVEDATVKLYKYDIVTNTYILVEEGNTNFEGETRLSVELSSEFYKFLVYYGGELKKETSPTYIYDTLLNIYIDLSTGGGEHFDKTEGVTHSLTFDQDNAYFRAYYDGTNSGLTYACLNIYRQIGNSKTLYNQSCQTSTSAYLYGGVVNVSGRSYLGQIVVTIDGREEVITELWYRYDEGEKEKFGKNGLFMLLIFTMTIIGIGAMFRASVAIFLAPIPLIIMAATHIVAINIGICIGLEVIAIIIAGVLEAKRYG